MRIVTEIKRKSKIFRKSLRISGSKDKRSIPNYIPSNSITIQDIPIDCLERIFSHITNISEENSNDILNYNIKTSTLFNCARVNKLWSALVIPKLWRRPFHFVLSDEQNCTLISTLILFLSEQDKNVLIDQQLKFVEMKNINDRFIKFNYPQLIKLFDYDNFIKSVHRWVVRYPNTCTEFGKSRLVTQLLGKVLFKGNDLNGFKTFNYFRAKIYDNFDFISLYKLIPQNSFGCFNNLTQLEYRNPHKVNKSNLDEFLNFFNIIILNCSDLKSISLDVRKEEKDDYLEIDYSISKLLSNQKRLENLSISYCSPMIYNSIFRHTHYLNYLHIKGINDMSCLLKLISSCKVLKTLELEQSWNKSDNDYKFHYSDLTKNFSLSHTTKLQIDHLYFNFNDQRSETLLICLLEMTNLNLKTLTTKLITFNIMRIISTFCTNISSLNISHNFSHIDFTSLLNILPVFPLRQLYLEISYSSSREYMDAEIYKLASSLPYTLENLYLKCHITPDYLDILLNRSRPNIKSLWLYNVSDYYMDYLKILYHYSLVPNNRLKDVRFNWNRSLNNSRRNRRSSSVTSCDDEEFKKTVSKHLKDARQSILKEKRKEKKESFDNNKNPFIISEVKNHIFSYHDKVFERKLSDYKDH
ncbi:unnamed protein product [Rhizophagus irregularis]|uniref:F-box domain-containing protein n=1 Tax=Rhizophagus irregularis TaxID=588596 RepID=A0A2N1NVT2_9GLOM|nr:hypothetical protein RhiirC2_843913 [Rhizophagus irregularis]CAB5337669.1 unnamed protein product [Rhizophagus irregularis]